LFEGLNAFQKLPRLLTRPLPDEVIERISNDGNWLSGPFEAGAFSDQKKRGAVQGYALPAGWPARAQTAFRDRN
jgi:hypothetical protein